MKLDIRFRNAELKDLERLVAMLADDELGSKREQYEIPLPSNYLHAFNAITSDPNNELLVAMIDEHIVGFLQITFTPYLTYQGGWRATIESVRTCATQRGKGIGSKLMNYAIQLAKKRGCHVVQLTTDKMRPEALHFYQKLGFKNSHEGLKLHF